MDARGTLAAVAAAVALVAGGCSTSGSGRATPSSAPGAATSAPSTAPSTGTATAGSLRCPQGKGTGAPGVTGNEIKVAAISTRSGPLAADFGGLVPGMKAYFDTVNAKGGVDGRKIVLAYSLDDGGVPTQFSAATHTAVDQDHAFAVAVSSYWFNPTYFVSTCTPTYGYNVAGNWTGAPNLFAAAGSVLTYATIVPAVGYLVHQTKATSIAVLGYSVSTSSDLCRTTVSLLEKAGYDVSFTDLKLTPINADLAPDVQRIQRAGADFIVSCMTVTGNVSLARAVQQYGLKVHQLWFDGADQAVVTKYASLLQGVYFNVEHVPIPAATEYPGTYPGLQAYLSAMKKYAPNDVGDEVAIQGWESAALMVAGIEAAGRHLTQASVVDATNQVKSFTDGGLVQPVDWSQDHSTAGKVNCGAFEQVRNGELVPVLGKGKQVFLCFTRTDVKDPTPTPTPPGLPGPAT